MHYDVLIRKEVLIVIFLRTPYAKLAPGFETEMRKRLVVARKEWRRQDYAKKHQQQTNQSQANVTEEPTPYAVPIPRNP